MTQAWAKRREKVRLGPLDVDFLASRIIAADGRSFKVEPKALEVLEVLANAEDQVIERDMLIDLCWQGYPGADESLTKAISKLRAVLRAAGADPNMIETIPKRGYRLSAGRDEAKVETPVAATPAVSLAFPSRSALGLRLEGSRLRLFAATGALFLAAIAIAAFWVPVPEKGRLPSVSLSFADDQTGQLAKLEASLAIALGEYGIPFSDDGSADIRLWASAYGSEMQIGVSDAQGEVLKAFEAGESPEKIDAAVYNLVPALACFRENLDLRMSSKKKLYLFIFCEKVATGKSRGIRLQTEKFANEAPGDPDAQAWHALGVALDPDYIWWTEEPGRREMERTEAIQLADRALAKDPGNGFALAALALLKSNDANLLTAVAALEDAQLAGFPATLVNAKKVLFLQKVGRFDEARRHAHRLVDQNPGSGALRLIAARVDARAGDVAAARNWLNHRSLAALPRADIAWVDWTTRLYSVSATEAQTMIAEIGENGAPEHSIQCDTAFVAILNNAVSRSELDAACARLQPDRRMRMLVRIGDLDGAFEIADSLPSTVSGISQVFFYPGMKRFLEDPRFEGLAERFGLIEYWWAGNWPDFCRIDAPDAAVCKA